MDNADLDSLKLVPGRLNPRFSTATTEYNVLLSSAAQQVRVECLTSDSGASYSIKGAGGERSVPLLEGTNVIKIEVSAIDGTLKCYTVTVTKLAANLAELMNLNLNPGKLDRKYQKKISEYYATLGWSVNQVTVKPVKQDPKMTVDIDGNPPETPIQLTSMETTVQINVLSPDKSTKKVYTLHLLKEDTGYRPDTSNTDLICGICSSLYQCPRKLLQCLHSFCTVCLAVSQRTDKKCPTCNAPPPSDPPFDEVDTALRDKVLVVEVNCFYCGNGVPNPQLLEHAVECPERLVTCSTCCQDVKHSTQCSDCTVSCKQCGQKYLSSDEQDHAKMCLQGSDLPNIELVGYKVAVSDWEKKLRCETADDFKELFEAGEKFEKEYHKVRASSSEVTEVKERLSSAANAYANAVQANSKSSKAHLRLGVVLEEIYNVQDLMAKGKEKKTDLASAANKEAKDSSKLEEIDAICQLHGVAATAPLSEKLKAIDTEYHSLKAKGDSFRADRVQELFVWKSKQASPSEKISLIAASDETYLGKAGKKYEDAVFLEPSSFSCNYLLGWSYLRQLRYEEATARFRVCLGAKPLLKHVRYLLGIALSQCHGEEHKDEATAYLKQGTLSFQHWVSCLKKDGPSGEPLMVAETEFSIYKPYYLRGFIYLADLTSSKEEKRKLLLSVVYLVPRILQTLQQRGEVYLSIEAVMFSAMDKLLAIVEEDEIQTFCKRLSMLLSKSPNSANKKLLELQVETCKKCLLVETSNGLSLNTLGAALLTLYDMTEKKALLKDAEQCFRAALDVEGKAITSKSVPEQVKAMQWYKKMTGAPKSPPPAGGKVAPGRGGAAKRGAAPAQRGGAASRGATRGGAAGRGAAKGAARGRGAARGAGARGGKVAPHECEPAANKVKEKKVEEKKSSPEPENETGPVNKKSVRPRLGLARVLSLGAGDTVEERKKLYNEVIELDSGLHDAYIELGELCRGTMQAVDVYSRFPFSEELSFDDAYIFGEMVQILMKLKEYDDPRLEKSLIGYGTVMGWNSLESFVRTLENAFKTAMLRNVYCAVNKKSPDDADVQQFFKVKLWH